MIRYSLQLSVLLSKIELKSTLNKIRVLFILTLIIFRNPKIIARFLTSYSFDYRVFIKVNALIGIET